MVEKPFDNKRIAKNTAFLYTAKRNRDTFRISVISASSSISGSQPEESVLCGLA